MSRVDHRAKAAVRMRRDPMNHSQTILSTN
jgi:hypothetical protein